MDDSAIDSLDVAAQIAPARARAGMAQATSVYSISSRLVGASGPHIGQAGYASTYYAYMWSLVIGKDLFGSFEGRNFVAPGIARKYRDTIFAPGSSKKAADLVTEFLGRPFNSDAWERWLNAP